VSWKNWLKTFLGFKQDEDKTQNNNASLDVEQKRELPVFDRKCRLYPVREWLLKNVSPYAWDRVTLRSIQIASKNNITLYNLINANENTIVPAEVMQHIFLVIHELYGVIPPIKKEEIEVN